MADALVLLSGDIFVLHAGNHFLLNVYFDTLLKHTNTAVGSTEFKKSEFSPLWDLKFQTFQPPEIWKCLPRAYWLEGRLRVQICYEYHLAVYCYSLATTITLSPIILIYTEFT